jgi:hypothetical protein
VKVFRDVESAKRYVANSLDIKGAIIWHSSMAVMYETTEAGLVEVDQKEWV